MRLTYNRGTDSVTMLSRSCAVEEDGWLATAAVVKYF